jgi:hypothetical protein
MTYAKPFLRLVLIGNLYGIDEFSCSLSMIQNNDSATPPTDIPAALVTACTSFWTTSFSGVGMISADAPLETIKLNEIGLDGKYTQAKTVFYDYPVAVKGVSSWSPPAQVAFAVSLDTPIKRGRAARGRFYLPLPGGQVDPTGATTGYPGCFTGQYQAGVANAAAQFLNEVNAAVPGYAVGVTSDIGTGTYQVVTKVRAGRVPDTIRSRRNKMVEAYYTSATPIVDV